MAFGERLRGLRQVAQMSGTALGARLSLSKQTISHWENGHHEPNIAQIGQICDIFNISADYLLRGIKTGSLGPETQRWAEHFQALLPHERDKWTTMLAMARDGPATELGHSDMMDLDLELPFGEEEMKRAKR
jgi:transcriptional regulator with XRE-family HTH domain